MGGCTGGEPLEERSPSITSAPPASPPTTPTPTATPLESLEFALQEPDPVCPAVSALDTLPLVDEHRYVLVDPLLVDHIDDDGFYRTFCGYERAELGDGDDMIIEDHASITAQIQLYRSWESSPNSQLRSWPALPVASDNLDDWERTATTRDDQRVQWEGCGGDTPCEEDEEPTLRTYVSRWAFRGHVGNLDFDEVRVQYVAQEIPADVESRVLAIFRDLVLAVLDTYERVD
jgi:hypothetical protein